MRKIFYLFLCFFLVAGLSAQQQAATFNLDAIQNWTGNGPNRSALAIQWITGNNQTDPAPADVHFLVWGYKWESAAKPTGLDMIRAIAKSDPRLFVMLENTENATVWGFGYDANKDGLFGIKNSKTTVTFDKDDFINGILSIKNDPDGFTPEDVADYWMGGWKDYYCTYYTGPDGINAPSTNDFSYAQSGAGQRLLANNSWDAWTLSPIDYATESNVPPVSKLMQAADAVDSPTKNETVALNKASVVYARQMLRITNLENYTCRIISMDGMVMEQFKVKEQNEQYPVSLKTGIYVLTGIKGSHQVSFRFSVAR